MVYKQTIRATLFGLLIGGTVLVGWVGANGPAALSGHIAPQSHTLVDGGTPIWPPPKI